MQRVERSGATGRTVTLKVKYSNFRQITRARSLPAPVSDRTAIGDAGRMLLASLCPVERGVRLLGLSLSSLGDAVASQLDFKL